MPMMAWDSYTGAEHYKVWYGPAGGLYFGAPLSAGTELQYAGFTATDIPTPAGTYKYYVEAFDVNDVHVAFSAEQTFTVTAPLELGSADYVSPPRCTLIVSCTTLSDTPTLVWEPIAGAGAYEVILANDAEFTNIVKRYKTIFTTLSPRESFVDQQAGQALYWFVKPCVDMGLSRCGPDASTIANDNASAFRKNSAAIEVLTPTIGQSIANQITFSWTAYLTTSQGLTPAVDQEARNYRIEVSTTADFAATIDTIVVDQTVYTAFDKTYPEGPLYWRVQALDGSGNALTKSPARLVNKVSPALTTTFPGNGSTQSGVPYFQWNPQAFAATYLVEIYKNGDTNFSPANLVLNQTDKVLGLVSDPVTWRPATTPGASAATTQTTGQAPGRPPGRSRSRPQRPTLTAPANGAAVSASTLLMTWSGVAGAVQYRVEVAATCAFSPIITNQLTVMAAFAPITAYANGTYCWRVRPSMPPAT